MVDEMDAGPMACEEEFEFVARFGRFLKSKYSLLEVWPIQWLL